MMRWVSSLVVGCLLLGCNQSEPKTGSAPAGEPAQTARPKAPSDLHACTADSECTMSGRVFTGDEACCVSPCITEAVNADALDAFASECKGKFSLSDCTRHECAPPPPTMARCIDNECAAVEGPVVTTLCEADDDCAFVDTEIYGDHLCCSSCPKRAANADALLAYKAWCADQPTGERCPEAECAPGERVTACVEGQCVARDGGRAPT